MAYEAGQWNANCDRCGMTFKARQLRLEWNGLRTCHGAGTTGCWEPKHDRQSPPPPRVDRQNVPWTRPEGPVRLAPPTDWDDL